jgi:hypothetical protein
VPVFLQGLLEPVDRKRARPVLKGGGGNTPPLLDEAQFIALRHFALDDTDHHSHKEQGLMIRRYIIWRNNHAYDLAGCHVIR